MELSADIHLTFRHRAVFTRDALDPANPVLAGVIEPGAMGPARVLAFVDTRVAQAWPDLPQRLRAYAAAHGDRLQVAERVQPVVGGELCKNDRDAIYRCLDAIHAAGIDRQSYVLAIGGGAVLDCVGFAAAIAHRGIRLLRMPTTTLAQADSGVGVKNGINGFQKKNFLGTFAVPWAVVNDAEFLTKLGDAQWRAGFVEAVKVACIKDRGFFDRIERDAAAIAARDFAAALPVIQRSAALHLEHIAYGGDPFELTEARPLDFGHWAAHKLESLTGFQLSHGDAVAIGIALDVTYAEQVGMLAGEDASRIRRCLTALGFQLFHPALQHKELIEGLGEFREHLGGRLTVTLLRSIGEPVDVHNLDAAAIRAAARTLATTPALG